MSDLAKRLEALSPMKRELLLKQLRAGPPATAPRPSLVGMSVAQMKAEAVLAKDIDPSAAQPSAPTPNAILLTGATGFIGAYLLDELLRQTSATIYCLVRASTREHALTRIVDNLSSYQLALGDMKRVVPVVGDLGQPGLGLTELDFDRLSQAIDAIYHCGAMVNWVYPLRSLRQANVGGTMEILRLATRHRLKPVHFISTVGVFSSPDYPHDTVLETEDLENSGNLYVGYAQSKWIAEKLVHSAGSRGLPVSIYRPNTAGDSRTGIYNQNDHVFLMIKGCLQLGSAPVLDLRIAGAPVDFVSRAIVLLSRQPSAQGKVFHLVNSNDIGWNQLIEGLCACGLSVQILPFADWVAELEKSITHSNGNALKSMLPFFTDSLFQYTKLPRFDCSNTQRELGNPFTCPPIDDVLLGKYLTWMAENGHLGELT